MTVRPLAMADWADAQGLYLELASSETVAGAAQFEAVLSHPGTTIFGLEQEGRVISMATLHVLPNVTHDGHPYGLVENVVTAARARGQGAGRAVMTGLAQAAQAAGCYKVMLLTGQARNARGFYEAVGFIADEKWGMIQRFEI